jgi:D-arabinose 1-dehydrogenase-like Zn-dependent alcohol dehydrogenase
MLSYQVEAFGKPLARALRKTPRPSGSEVLVKVAACGVCHTDVHLHDGCFDLGGGAKLDLARSVAPPRTLGHEIAGTVVAVGPDVQGVKVGDSRIVFPWIGCGACTLCTAGQEHICIAAQSLGVNRDGGFADHVLVPHARYLVDHGSLPVEQACTYACAGLTAFSALKKAATVSADDGTPAPLGAEDALLILGAGGVGLSGIRLARVLYPDAPIVVAEVDEGRFALALQAGATECLNPNSEGVGRSLFKSTGGGVAAAVDFVGTASTFAFGFGALRKAGRFVAVGLPRWPCR